MASFLSAPRAYLRDARAAFAHAPLEVLLGVSLAVTFSIMQRQPHDHGKWWAHVLALACIALPPLFALSMLRALGRVSPAQRWGAAAALLAAAGAYAAFVFSPARGAEGWRTAALAAAGVLAVALVPAVGAEPGEAGRRRFWRFCAAAGARIVVVIFYGALLYAALAGALAAVKALFDISRGDRLFADMASAIFFALVPWVVVGGIPELAARTEAGAGEAGRAVRLLGRYLYLPVLAIYLAILYAYTVRVLATGELPKNLLSPLLLFAGLFGLLLSLALEPLLRDPGERAVGWMLRAFPALLLLLLPLPIWAVWVRRDQYGWTEFRYLRLAVLLALLGLSIAGTVRLVRRRSPLLAAVPATLCLVLLASAIGPWSAPAVSRRDQLGRLRAALAQAGLLRDGRVTGLPETGIAIPPRAHGRVIPQATYERLTGALHYLVDAHGPESVAGIIPQAPRFKTSYALSAALPVRPGCARGNVRNLAAALPGNAGVPGLRGGTLFRLRTIEPAVADTVAAPGRLVAAVQGNAVRLRQGSAAGWQMRVDVSPLVARLQALPATCEPAAAVYVPEDGGMQADVRLTAAEALRPVLDGAGREVGQAILTRLTARDSASITRLNDVDGWVVIGP
jgi:hypothetical protein